MNVTVAASPSQPNQHRAVLVETDACVCGQDLECCHQKHCPRCGRTLRR